MEVLGSIVRNGLFDLLPFFIRYGNINFMGGGAVPNGQGVALASNWLFGQVRSCRFLRYRIHSYSDQAVKIQYGKFLFNQFGEAFILVLMYLHPIYQITDRIIHQICIYLKLVLFVLSGGIGQPDMPQVCKFHFGTVFPFTKFGNQSFGGIKL